MLNSTDCYAILLIIRYGRREKLKSCINLILIIKNHCDSHFNSLTAGNIAAGVHNLRYANSADKRFAIYI